MTLLILTPNPDPPYNMRQICPSYKVAGIGGITHRDIANRVIARKRANGTIASGDDAHIVDSSDLPPRWNEFFNAGSWADGPIIDMAKARVIHMDRIRIERNTRLYELDVLYMQADEAGSDGEAEKAIISAEKQRLRDIPQTFALDGYLTPDELIAAWPTIYRPIG